jgi:hypothetical protein
MDEYDNDLATSRNYLMTLFLSAEVSAEAILISKVNHGLWP